MAQYVIQGGTPLSGEIKVAGSKNEALKAIAASLLSEEPMTIHNVPDIEDVRSLLQIVEGLGGKVSRADHTLTLETRGVRSGDLTAVDGGRIRATTVLVGPLLARFGEVRMRYPGGDKIGRRPIDLFMQGFKALGAKVNEDGEEIVFQATKMQNAHFFFPFVSVTATEAMLLAAATISGRTVLENAAMEPEIPALAEYLNQHGVRISGAGTPTIAIEGSSHITAGELTLIPDRVETGTFVILGVAAKSPLTIMGGNPEHVKSLLAILSAMGAPVEVEDSIIRTASYASALRAANVRTHEYPGFMTDLQAPLTVLLTQAQGQSLVHETIFEGRLFYTDLLNRMGANIILCDPHRALVHGPTPLRGKRLESPDIRAGIAMVIAGLLAKGETIIDNIYQIERGYERLVDRLQSLGADIRKTEGPHQ